MNEFKLVLSTGESVSLLSGLPTGFNMNEWIPKIAQRKGSGTFQDSPISPGRRLVYEQFADVQEEISFTLSGWSETDALMQLTELVTNFLEQVVGYWVNDWEDTFCYLEVKTKCGNTFYTILKSYTLPELSNPFRAPFYSKQPAMPELSMTLERNALWSKLVPGQGEDVNILVRDTERSEEGISYVSNLYSDIPLTHIFVDDGGVFSANQVASTAFDLLPAVPAVNDAIYFGNSDGYPFSSLILDIAQAFTGTSVALNLEYWSGATWTSFISEVDQTDSFQNTGVNSIAYGKSSSWATTIVNEVNALWVRFRVTAAVGVTANPTQQNRIVYTLHNPFIDIAAEDVSGDEEAICKLILDCVSGISTDIIRNYLIGRRRVDRGSDFNAYINLSDRNVPTGITFTNIANTGMIFSDNNRSPNGRVLLYDASADSFGTGVFVDRTYIDFSQDLSDQYSGKYRGFLIANFVSGFPDLTGQIRIENQSETTSYYDSGELDFGSRTSEDYLISLPGTIDIPNDPFPLRIIISIRVNQALNRDYELFYFVFVPVDEMAVGLFGSGTSGVNNTRYIEVSSLDPKTPLQSLIKNQSDDSKYATVAISANNLLSLEEKKDQRLWIFNFESDIQVRQTYYNRVSELLKNERYISLRGSQ